MAPSPDPPPELAIALAHPARLRAHAARHGLGSAALDGSFRLLDLACGGGANVLPLAARFSEARFVGTDRNAEALGRARRMAERCELANVDFIEPAALEVDAEEPFDFVLAHGIYSWVEPAAQRSLLATCGQALASDGVALVSYNTYPGWAVRGVMREVMLQDADGTDPEALLLGARATAARIGRRLGQLQHPYQALLAAELELFRSKGEAELLDDDLAEPNEPLYFRDFAARAAEHGLKYLAELVPASPDGALDAEVVAELMEEGQDRVAAEQLLDVVAYRQLRATLLCRADRAIRPLPDEASLLEQGYFAARLAPQTEEPLLGPGRSLAFRAPSGAVIEAERPLLKAALLALAEGWPRGYGAQALATEAIGQLRMRDLATPETVSDVEIQTAVSDLVALTRRRQIELLGWRPEVVDEVAAQPRVHALTRAEADRSAWVTTARHDPVELDSVTRAVVRLLDGSRDLGALTKAISQRLDAGAIELDGELPAVPRDEAIASLVLQALVMARDLGLLVAGA